MTGSVVTIERFIIEQERLHPQATGQLSGILYDMALAAKMIANKVRSAGLAVSGGRTRLLFVGGSKPGKLSEAEAGRINVVFFILETGDAVLERGDLAFLGADLVGEVGDGSDEPVVCGPIPLAPSHEGVDGGEGFRGSTFTRRRPGFGSRHRRSV